MLEKKKPWNDEAKAKINSCKIFIYQPERNGATGDQKIKLLSIGYYSITFRYGNMNPFPWNSF